MTTPGSDHTPGAALPPRRRTPTPSVDLTCCSDDELMWAHLEGNQRAFSELVRRHEQRLWLSARARLKRHHDASDVVQDALVRAFRFAHTWRGDGSVAMWLHRIVTRVALERAVALGKRSMHETSLDADLDNELAVGDNAAEAVAEAVVQEVVSRLPADQADCFVRVHLLGFSYAEAAAELGLAEGTVKSRAARGKARLVAALRDTGLVGSTRNRLGPAGCRDRLGAPAGKGRSDGAAVPMPRDEDASSADEAAHPHR